MALYTSDCIIINTTGRGFPTICKNNDKITNNKGQSPICSEFHHTRGPQPPFDVIFTKHKAKAQKGYENGPFPHIYP